MQIDDFDDYFAALHGQRPFPWQRRLARQVCESGQWPALVALPTGAGKTACLDIAVFHLAWSAFAGRQLAARRIAWVVDRRIVGDEASRRAALIKDALDHATDTGSVLARCARALRQLGGESALHVVNLHGGMPSEAAVIRDPITPTLVLSTVDQIGSRLLFRGYGVSSRWQSITAGLFGFDTLVLLDEVQLAGPLQQTLSGIVREQQRASAWASLPRPMHYCQLSATPARVADFSIDASDVDDPELGRSLRAARLVELAEVADRAAMITELVRRCLAALAADPPSDEALRLGIVVNQFASARELYERLTKALKGSAELYLLTGRMRLLDRDRLVTELGTRLLASASLRTGARPIVVVATQAIEVGADVDFHRMLVEAASYSAIRQRLGRLNRRGHQAQSHALIVYPLKGSADDPIYGSALSAGWQFLKQQAGDRLHLALGEMDASGAGVAVMPQARPTPLLTPAIVDLLAQTQPRPLIEPEIAPLLHGFDAREPDLSLVWRSGLCGDAGQMDLTLANAVLRVLPPTALEAMTIPRSALLQWLSSLDGAQTRQVDSSDDIEGDRPDAASEDTQAARKVLALRGERWALQDARHVRSGSVVVVPCEWGGHDEFGLAPGSKAAVADLGETARAGLQQSAATVLAPARLLNWGYADTSAACSELRAQLALVADQAATPSQAATVALAALLDAASTPGAAPVPAALAQLAAAGFRVTLCQGLRGSTGFTLRALRPSPGDFGDQDGALQGTGEVELDEHGRGVAEAAARFALGARLCQTLANDLQLAARMHDIGKADPRFQTMLGNRDHTRQLAKGAWADADLGSGSARHEAYSVALLQSFPALLTGASDPDLVIHLVGSHHGHGRAWQPDLPDAGTSFVTTIDGKCYRYAGSPDLGSLASGWAGRFARLQRRYGHWGLAYLEAVVRLADQRRSELELTLADRSAS